MTEANTKDDDVKKFTFDEVIEGLKNGSRFARYDWQVQGIFIATPPTLPNTIIMKSESDKLLEWIPSQSDKEAKDWIELGLI